MALVMSSHLIFVVEIPKFSTIFDRLNETFIDEMNVSFNG